MSKEVWTTCNMCHLCYQSTTRRVEKQACLVPIGIVRMHFNASCDENGPNLSSNPTPCFLVPTIVKCSKLVMMEAQTLLYFYTLACLMDNELVWQYKLALMEKNTLVPVEVIDGQSFSSRQITHETKPLDVTISSHTSKVVFYVISSPKNHVIIRLSWLILHNPWVD